MFDRFYNSGAIDAKMDASVFKEEESFRILWLFFFLNRIEAHIISATNTASIKIGGFVHSVKFLSPWVALYLYKFIIRPSMEYSCHVSHLSTTFAPIYVK